MLSNKKVQILVSTYNGETYLKEQLDSLFAQTYKNIEVLIRDDGSTDKTLEIIKEYQKINSNIILFEESNIGLTKSFLNLIEKSDADYVAFSDQDDVWMEEKVQKAVEALESVEGPALYCSNQILVDTNLRPLETNGVLNDPRPAFENAVIESMCTGCTAMINKVLADNIKLHMPTHAIWHDWWCYLVASYLGTVVFDKNAYIYYRQHGNNQLGSSRSAIQMIKNKWTFLKKTRGRLGEQLGDFAKEYHGYDERKDAMVSLLLRSKTSFKARIKLAFGKQIYRQKPLDNLVVRGLYLLNRML